MGSYSYVRWKKLFIIITDKNISISSEDEMNLVLLRLIEYLGHTNPLISGLGFEEVSTLPPVLN